MNLPCVHVTHIRRSRKRYHQMISIALLIFKHTSFGIRCLSNVRERQVRNPLRNPAGPKFGEMMLPRHTCHENVRYHTLVWHISSRLHIFQLFVARCRTLLFWREHVFHADFFSFRHEEHFMLPLWDNCYRDEERNRNLFFFTLFI